MGNEINQRNDIGSLALNRVAKWMTFVRVLRVPISGTPLPIHFLEAPPPRFLGSCIWLLFFIWHDYEVSYHFFQPCQNSRSTKFSDVRFSVVIFTTDAICIDISKRSFFHLSCCVGSCGAWGSWGSCSKTCGSGFKLRERKCPENSLHLEKQKTSCNTNLCPGQRKEA